MISQVTGEIINLDQNNRNIVLLNNGIGFDIKVNLKTLSRLKRNQQETLHVIMITREDSLTLFGFKTQAEKEIFEKLIKVSGVGPKSALSILEILDVNQIISAVIKEDSKLIANAQGIGNKTAQRIILELKNIFSKVEYSNKEKNFKDFDSSNEVYSVLTELGFSAIDISEKLKLAKEQNQNDDVESLVRFCLAS